MQIQFPSYVGLNSLGIASCQTCFSKRNHGFSKENKKHRQTRA